jgi:hypothetical protein
MLEVFRTWTWHSLDCVMARIRKHAYWLPRESPTYASAQFAGTTAVNHQHMQRSVEDSFVALARKYLCMTAHVIFQRVGDERVRLAQCVVLATLAAFALPASAGLCSVDTVHTYGSVTIRVTRTAGVQCGCDFVVSNVSADILDVNIDYTYWGLKVASVHPLASAVPGTHSGTIYSTVSQLQPLQRFTARVGDNAIGMLCAPEPDLTWSPRIVNRGQQYQDQENAQQRKRELDRERRLTEEQRRLAEAQRAAEEARRIGEMQRDHQLAAGRRLYPNCIITEVADIQQCARADARVRADEVRRRQQQVEAEALLRNELEQQRLEAAIEARSRAMNAQAQQNVRTPCAAVASNAANRPRQQPYPTGADDQMRRSMDQQYRMTLAQYEAFMRQLQIACNASGGR